MNNTNVNKRKTILTIAIALMLLAIITTASLAFLTDIFETDNTATVGSVKAGLYNNNGNTLISGYENGGQYILGAPILVTLGGTANQPTNVDLWVKNTGTINGLVRVLITITYTPENDTNMLQLTETVASITNTGWVNQFADTSTAGTRVFYLYAYYNSQIAPNTAVRVLNSITPKTAAALSAEVEITVRADMVAYSGNAYKIEAAGTTVPSADKPFKDFTSADLTSAFLTSWTAWQ